MVGLVCAVLFSCGDDATQAVVPDEQGSSDLEVRSPLTWVTPKATTAYANSHLRLEVKVSGAAPDSVRFEKDGQTLASFSSGPFAFEWDTSAVPEGKYRVKVVAQRGAATLENSRAVVIDRSPPKLVEVNCQGSDVLPSDMCFAQFSKSMNSELLKTLKVVDDTGAAVAHSFAFDSNQDFAWFTLDPKVALPITVNVALDASVTDRAGNPLSSAPTTWRMRFSNWASRGAVPGSQNAVQLSLAAGHQGELFAAWQTQTSNVGTLHAAVRKGGTWSALGQAISPASAYDAKVSPILKVGPDGHPWLAFSQGRVFVFRFDGSAWQQVGSSLLVDAAAGHFVYALQFAFDTAGVPFVGWVEAGTYESNAQVNLRRLQANEWESLPGTFPSHDAIRSAGFQLVAGSQPGHLVVSWSWSQGGAGHVFASMAQFDGQGGWTGIAPPDDVGSSGVLSMASASDGRLFAAYSAMVGADVALMVQSFDGTRWTKLGARATYAGSGGYPGRPQLLVTADLVPALTFSAGGFAHVARWYGTGWGEYGWWGGIGHDDGMTRGAEGSMAFVSADAAAIGFIAQDQSVHVYDREWR